MSTEDRSSLVNPKNHSQLRSRIPACGTTHGASYSSQCSGEEMVHGMT